MAEKKQLSASLLILLLGGFKLPDAIVKCPAPEELPFCANTKIRDCTDELKALAKISCRAGSRPGPDRRNKNRTMSLKEIAIEFGGVDQSTKTVQNLLTIIFKKTKSKGLRELAHKLPAFPPRS